MKYLIPIIIAILFFSCEEGASTTSYQEAYILDTKVSGISWTDKDCNIDSTLLYMKNGNRIGVLLLKSMENISFIKQ